MSQNQARDKDKDKEGSEDFSRKIYIARWFSNEEYLRNLETNVYLQSMGKFVKFWKEICKQRVKDIRCSQKSKGSEMPSTNLMIKEYSIADSIVCIEIPEEDVL